MCIHEMYMNMCLYIDTRHGEKFRAVTVNLFAQNVNPCEKSHVTVAPCSLD